MHHRASGRRFVAPVATALAAAVLLAAPSREARSAAPSRPSRAAAGAETSPAPRTLPPLPVRFEPNVGQSDPAVRYLARCPGFTMFLTDEEAVLALTPPRAPRVADAAPPADAPPHLLRMRFAAPGTRTRFVAGARLPGESNYFIGADPARHRTGVPGFDRVEVLDAAPGIDVTFRGDPTRLEYDVTVAPGADLGAAVLEFHGATTLALDGDGSLVVGTPVGDVRHSRPILSQEVDGRTRPVAGGFALLGGARVGFSAGEYDRTRALLVDPRIDYATYLGGPLPDGLANIATDSSGALYGCGSSPSAAFPLFHAVQPWFGGGSSDAYVLKLSPAGSLVYATYLGGNGYEGAGALAVAPSGILCVAGNTSSLDFPLVNPLFSGEEIARMWFVAWLSATGASIVGSSTLPGNYQTWTAGMAAYPDGSVVLAGQTTSADLPVTPGALQATLNTGPDAFLARFAPSGTALQWLTYFGGSAGDGFRGVALGPQGRIHVAGWTSSLDYPVKDNFQPTFANYKDGVLTVFESDGKTLVHSTFLGGEELDECEAIAVDAAGNSYVTGYTRSFDFPVTDAYEPGHRGDVDAFVARIGPDGGPLLAGTFLGGLAWDHGTTIAIDGAGRVHVGGHTSSTDFPVLFPVLGASVGYGGKSDGFLARFDSTLSTLQCGSYVGGTGAEPYPRIAVTASATVWILLGTESSGLYTTAGAISADNSGYQDAWIARAPLSPPDAPSPVLALPLSFVGTVGVSCRWTGAGAPAETFTVERRIGEGNWKQIAVVSGFATAHVDTGLPALTEVSYRVRGTNPDGTSPWSDTATATTGEPLTIPAAPDGLAAEALSPFAVRCTWTDSSTDETGFEIGRASGTAALIGAGTFAAGTEETIDTPVEPDRAYLYRVRALGTGGASGWSAEAAVTTPPTLAIEGVKGSLRDAEKPGRDRVKIAATIRVLADALDDSLDPAADGLRIDLGDAGSPLTIQVAAGDPAWKARKGRFRWKSSRKDPVRVAISLDTRNGRLAVAASRFDFEREPENPVLLSVRTGEDAASRREEWVERKAGEWRSP